MILGSFYIKKALLHTRCKRAFWMAFSNNCKLFEYGHCL